MGKTSIESASGAQTPELLPAQRKPGQFEGSVTHDYLEALGQWVVYEGMDILDAMIEGSRYRRLMVDVVYQHWQDSRFDKHHKLEANAATNELALRLYTIDWRNSVGVKRVGDECLPYWDKVCRLQFILANVYGVTLEEQQELTDTIAQQWVKLLGTADEVLSTPERQQKVEQEVDVLEAYLDEYEKFKTRYLKELSPIAKTTTPGTARRTVFQAVLYTMYEFDPRKRQALLAPTKDPSALALQARLYQEEALMVQAAVGAQLGEKNKKVDLSKYL